MKIAVLIPDRGDRPDFLLHCIRMLARQTIAPDHVEIMNQKPLSNDCDITFRYRTGYERLKEYDAIFFMENDDYYAPNYIETMLNAWIEHGKPDLFGTTYTIYYNLRVKGYFTMHHPQKSQSMCTIIKPNLTVPWPLDHDPYTDATLYKNMNYQTFVPKELICLGIKHGIGKCGGGSHISNLYRYETNGGQLDPNMDWLRANTDPESFTFYASIVAQQSRSMSPL